MAKNLKVEEVAAMQLLKVFSDLRKAQDGVKRALDAVKTIKGDIRFEEKNSDDCEAKERMLASSITVDYLAVELKIIDAYFKGMGLK